MNRCVQLLLAGTVTTASQSHRLSTKKRTQSMTFNNTINWFKKIYHFLTLLFSIAGYVPKHATVLRTIAISSSIAFSIYLTNYQPHNNTLAIFYFILIEACYISFLVLVLSHNGYRLWFIRRWGNENKGYLAYEAILGFLFFHNGVSIGYIASSTPGSLFYFIHKELLFVIVAIMFVIGFITKIWAAKVVSIDIYYCKDMFLGKKMSDFVVVGPYKYFNNPMYGIGHLQAYAIAIWYGSEYGLVAAFLNQCLIYLFYYKVENKFIKRVSMSRSELKITETTSRS